MFKLFEPDGLFARGMCYVYYLMVINVLWLICALPVVTFGASSAALYACPILAMAALLPVRERFGTGAAMTTYAAVSLLALLLATDKELALLYAFFGWYVPLQPALDKVRPRLLGAHLKR